MVKDRRAGRLERLALGWTRQVALQRVEAWLGSHPLVKAGNLAVQVPGSLEPADLASLDSTQPDGLGVTLGGEQKALLAQARAALSRAFTDAAAGPSRRQLDAGSAAGRGARPRDSARSPAPRAAGALRRHRRARLGGQGRAGPARHRRRVSRGPCASTPKLVGTPVPSEGPVAHALEVVGGGRLEGIGLLLAAAAGAAFSSSTVILPASASASARSRPAPLLNTFARLALARLRRPRRPGLGRPRSRCSTTCASCSASRCSIGPAKRAAALAPRGRAPLAAREPLWKGEAAAECKSPELALFSACTKLQVKLALERAAQAGERLLELIDKLAHPGRLGTRSSRSAIAAWATCWPAWARRSCATPRPSSLSAGREAMAMTAALAAVPPPVRPGR